MNTHIARALGVAALLVAATLSVTACGSSWTQYGGGTLEPGGQQGGAASVPARAPARAPVGVVPSAAAGAPGAGRSVRTDGIVATAESSEELFEARDIRLVRSGVDEVAVQFELHNGSGASSSPSRWVDPKTRRLVLFDLPRGTSYQPLRESRDPGYKGQWGRLSPNWMDTVLPGRSITLTAVFAAPPPEAASLLVSLGDLVPVQVPVQPAGAPALRPDPVLSDSHRDPVAGPLVCAAAQRNGPTEFRLPADVLFAFGSAALTPAALTAIDALVKQVNGTAGKVSVQGNTDSIGTDAYNQTLSEQRAGAVAGVLKERLGPNFTFEVVGFGKTKPVAPNTNPDGSDNPSGRAQNRRVDIEVTTTNPAPAPAPAAAPPPAGEPLATAAILKPTVLEARRDGGYLLTTLRVINPNPTPAAFGYNNQVTAESAKGGLFPGELAIQDPAGNTAYSLCIPGGTPNTYFSYAASTTNYPTVPAGGSLTLWGITPAPPTTTPAVTVRIGGFADPINAPITADPPN